MNQEFLSTKPDNRICEAVGCNEKVVTIIQVKVSQRDSITLFVCERCVDKFSHENTNQIKNKLRPHSAVIGSACDLYTEGQASTDGDQNPTSQQ